MNRCGCNPKPEPYEFPIIDIQQDNILLPQNQVDYDNICQLKQKTISEFLDIIDQLECGKQPSLEFLLEEISLIYIYE